MPTRLDPTRTIDVTALRRLKGLLNLARNVGIIFGTFALLAALVYPWLALIAVLMFWGSARVWHASVAGAAVQSAVALLGAAVFLHGFLASANPALGNGRDPEREMIAALSRKLYLSAGSLCLLAALVFLVALWAAIKLKRALPNSAFAGGAIERSRRYWLALSTSKRRLSAVTYMGLAAVLGTLAATPAIVVLAPLVVGPRLSSYALSITEAIFEGPLWLFLIALAAMFILIWGTLVCGVRAKRLATPRLSDARSIDPRDHVLLLRSFRDDVTPLDRTTSSHAWGRTVLYGGYWTLEETLETTLRIAGPVIAIGRPGEGLPPAGAAREYVSNEDWRERVRQYIQEAQLAVVILGKGEGLEFEYRALVEAAALHKLMLVFPPVDSRELRQRWMRFASISFGQLSPDLPDPSKTLVAFVADDGQPGFITCRWRDDEDCYRIALARCLQEIQTTN